MDLMGELLLTMRVDASSIGVFHSVTDWGLQMPCLSDQTAVMYCILETPCWLLREGAPPEPLKAGSAVLVRAGAEVGFASTHDARLESFLDIWLAQGLPPTLNERSRREVPIDFGFDPAHRSPRMLAVACVLHEPERNRLWMNLPEVLVLDRQGGFIEQWISTVLNWLITERLERKPGFSSASTSLASFLLTGFIREYMTILPIEQSAWMNALADPRIGQTLVLMHSHPHMELSIDTLAAEAHMSRATFSRRFKALVGHSPGQYLIATRMRYAVSELRSGNASVAQVATQAGYSSESAFRSAFRIHFGMSPREYLSG